MTTTAIWWIRRDLRLTDNQALTAALAAAEVVIPVFVIDPGLLKLRNASERRTSFLLSGLRVLSAAIEAVGGRLIVRHGDPATVLAELCEASGASAVYAESDVSPYAAMRDGAVTQALGGRLHLTDGLTIRPIRQTVKEDGTPYTVFTPFSRRWRMRPPIQRSDILPAPTVLRAAPLLASDPIPVTMASAASSVRADDFPPGEAAALRRLDGFANGAQAPIYRYAQDRDRPALEGTAGLSPYLRFGMVSPRLAALAAYTASAKALSDQARAGADAWLTELIWRDFYCAILHHFPHVSRGSFRPEYDQIAWDNDEASFAAWCAGQTGYPFIDAAMRQLAARGWMHNRARMAVASFLVKDLLIDWRWGERWFMQMLIDGDPAANNGGWQWSAGTGTDAAPYFRIFNPIAQGQKFDPEGAYVRRWVPELRTVPARFIHEPWRLAYSDQLRVGCVIGRDYPAPIVDHALARARVLAAYQAVRT